jgi:hypothetical protein
MKPMPYSLIAAALTASLALTAAAPALADPLPAPTGEVILTVSGAIANTNGEGTAAFDRAMLEALGTAAITTSTTWTEGTPTFTGVPAAAVMAAVGAGGQTAVANALDDYTQSIPITTLAESGALLAFAMDGEPLPADRAPLWIVWPRDAKPELATEAMDSFWVWQLVRFDVR